MTQEARPDARFADPRLGAIPTMRFANEEAMSLKVREIAQMVGQEKFYLTVGRLLHKKGATVGLKPDGVVVRNDAERISAARTLEERVHEAESHKRTVINPAIGEFVAMMNQVDELQQVRAEIAQQQIRDNVPKSEREKNNREIKEFLEKPEVKEKFQKLKLAREKQQRAAEELRRLEAEDPTLPTRMAGMPTGKDASATSSATPAPKTTTKSTVAPKPTIQKALTSDVSFGVKKPSHTTSVSEPLIARDELTAPSVSSIEMDRVFAWETARKENKSGGREAMEVLSSINESLDAFAVDHPNIAKVGTAIVEGIGYAAIGGTLLVAAEGGVLPFALTGSTMLASNEVVAAVLEHGSEPLVKGAASLGTTEAEAVRFGTNMAGAINKLMFLGATKLAVKVVKGGKGTVKNLSLSEATTVSKQSFREMQINPAEFQAFVSKGLSEAMGKNPLLKMEMERLGIIQESEMVNRALSAPTEWNGQFKLVREIQPTARGTEFASEIYSREVVFKDPKSGQMFRAFQRNDIDPNYVVRSGTTNLDLMRQGLAPRTNAGEPVIIHHMGQSAFGPFVEVTPTTHGSFLHNQFGTNRPHPSAPVIRFEFDPIRQAYWRAYAESFR